MDRADVRTPSSHERSLIEAAQDEPEKFADLYRANVGSVHAFVLSRTGDRDVAEEVTAEVFVRALKSLPRFEWRGTPYSSYLVRIADRLLVDRAHARRRGIPVEDGRPEDAFVAVDRAVNVERLLSALSADQRTVLVLRFVEDRSLEEVSAAMRRSTGAIKQLQHRAIRSLRALAGEEAG